MRNGPVRKFDLKDQRQYDEDQTYWRQKSGEERLSALEELRRQFGLFSDKWQYDGSQRLRRVFRVVQ
jgi:hypothetical protein